MAVWYKPILHATGAHPQCIFQDEKAAHIQIKIPDDGFGTLAEACHCIDIIYDFNPKK